MKEFFRELFFGKKKVSNQRQRPSVRPMLEQVESRYLPNAGPLFAGLGPFAFGNPEHFGALTAGCQGQNQGQTQTLVASLTGATGTSGTAVFRANSTTGDNSLTVRVSGLTANSTFTVTSGTQTLGTINTDANGRGYFSVSNVSPALTSGATITVSDSSGATVLSGPLASLNSSSVTRLNASLSGATGTSGTAHFEGNTAVGGNRFSVRVSGLTANSTYTVQIGGTTVGQVNTDADGDGFLSESNVSPTVASGTVLTILDSSGATVLKGTFATATGHEGFSGFHRFGGDIF
jgi:hypothetical protein